MLNNKTSNIVTKRSGEKILDVENNKSSQLESMHKGKCNNTNQSGFDCGTDTDVRQEKRAQPLQNVVISCIGTYEFQK